MSERRRIESMALIGNCRTAALVASDGSIPWCCLPRFDAPALFASLLDAELGGELRIRSLNGEAPLPVSQRYLDGTALLETRVSGRANPERELLEITDAFSINTSELEALPETEILRRLRAVAGEVFLEIEFYPTSGFGIQGNRLSCPFRGVIRSESGDHTAFLTFQGPEAEVRFEKREVRGIEEREVAILSMRLAPGQTGWLALTHSTEAPAVFAPLGPHAQDRLDATERFWRAWSARCTYRGPYRDAVIRSCVTLKLLTFAPSGAVVAAPTSSLPEWPGGTRNWDYRFCWLRDSSFTARALVSMGYIDEAKDYVNWLLQTTHLSHPSLHVLYSLYGGMPRRERKLPWLEGYSGARPVRLGNAAARQFQYDVYGEVIDAFHALFPYLDRVDNDSRRFLIKAGREVCDLWHLPDHGIWESRAHLAHHTHSKVMCWAALDRLCNLGHTLGWDLPAEIPRSRERIRHTIESRAIDVDGGYYLPEIGSPYSGPDASLLSLPLVGYCGTEHPPMKRTQQWIEHELVSHGLMYRYHRSTDGFADPEGAFGLCCFWMAETLAMAGRLNDSRSWIDRMLRYASPTGLWAEEIEPLNGEALGNYPQAFTHVGMINAAVRLQCEEEKPARERESA